jgi:hypothetical protein
MLKIQDGSAWDPVILPVFKTGGRFAMRTAGAFDSHTLPPVLRRGLLRTSLVAEGGLSADFWHSPDRELHLC